MFKNYNLPKLLKYDDGSYHLKKRTILNKLGKPLTSEQMALHDLRNQVLDLPGRISKFNGDKLALKQAAKNMEKQHPQPHSLSDFGLSLD